MILILINKLINCPTLEIVAFALMMVVVAVVDFGRMQNHSPHMHRKSAVVVRKLALVALLMIVPWVLVVVEYHIDLTVAVAVLLVRYPI